MLTGLRARRCQSPELLHMISLQEESLACCNLPISYIEYKDSNCLLLTHIFLMSLNHLLISFLWKFSIHFSRLLISEDLPVMLGCWLFFLPCLHSSVHVTYSFYHKYLLCLSLIVGISWKKVNLPSYYPFAV